MVILIQNIYIYQKVIIMQKYIVLSILKTKYREQSHPRFTHLNLIKSHEMYEIEIGNVMYTYIYGSIRHIPCLIYLHLPMICPLNEHDKCAIYMLLLVLVYFNSIQSRNVLHVIIIDTFLSNIVVLKSGTTVFSKTTNM